MIPPTDQGEQGVGFTLTLDIDLPDDDLDGVYIQMPDGRVLCDGRSTMNQTSEGTSQ